MDGLNRRHFLGAATVAVLGLLRPSWWLAPAAALPTPDLLDGKWHHVQVFFDRAGRETAYYVDGERCARPKSLLVGARPKGGLVASDYTDFGEICALSVWTKNTPDRSQLAHLSAHAHG